MQVIVNINPSWSLIDRGFILKTHRRQNNNCGSNCHCLRWSWIVPLNDTNSIDQAFTLLWWNHWDWDCLRKVSGHFFLIHFFVKCFLKPSFESSTICDWSAVDLRFRPELKYVRAGQVFAVPALFVVEHIASSDVLQTLISHLKVIDSVADDPRVAPVKANCLFLIFKMVIYLGFICMLKCSRFLVRFRSKSIPKKEGRFKGIH